MAIRTECIVSLKKCHFIMAVCAKCKSEVKVEAGRKPNTSCPICKSRYTAAQEYALVQISEAIDELKKSLEANDDVHLITIEQ